LEGEFVSKEVGEEEEEEEEVVVEGLFKARRRGAREEEWTGGATTPTAVHVEIDSVGSESESASRPRFVLRP